MREKGSVCADEAIGAVDGAALYALYRVRVFNYLLATLRSRQDAEDALQETYCRALRSLHGGFQPESPLAWLLTIARNLCISGFRARRATVGLEAVAELPTPMEPPHGELFSLSRALADLPDAQRRAVVLRDWCGLSYDEIAGVLGVSCAAVTTQVFRGRNALAAGLTQPGPARRQTAAQAARPALSEAPAAAPAAR